MQDQDLASFFTHRYTAKAKLEIADPIVNYEVARQGYNNRELVRRVRARAKKYPADPKYFYETIEKTFFHGRANVPNAEMSKCTAYQKSLR